MSINLIRRLTITALAIIALVIVVLFPKPSGAIGTSVDNIAKLFEAKCAKCHAGDGSGTAIGKKMKAPDLRSAEVKKLSDDKLVEAIANGKKPFHKFGKKLKEEQIRQLAAYVRGLGK